MIDLSPPPAAPIIWRCSLPGPPRRAVYVRARSAYVARQIAATADLLDADSQSILVEPAPDWPGPVDGVDA